VQIAVGNWLFIWHDNKLLFALTQLICLIVNLDDYPEWLGWQDSNLRMAVPKTAALPLGDIPIINFKLCNINNHKLFSRDFTGLILFHGFPA
jgi:hypothetical protein